MVFWWEIFVFWGYFILCFVVLLIIFILECIEIKIWIFLRVLFVVFFVDSVMGKLKLNKGIGKWVRSSLEDEVRWYKMKVFVIIGKNVVDIL